MEKKKIYLLVPSPQSGESERAMSELAEYICDKTNFEVHLVLFGIEHEIFYKVPPSLKIHKPAVIISHRFIYVGFIDKVNRDRSLKMLNQLLSSAFKPWPDIEFLTSDQIGKTINLKK